MACYDCAKANGHEAECPSGGVYVKREAALRLEGFVPPKYTTEKFLAHTEFLEKAATEELQRNNIPVVPDAQNTVLFFDAAGLSWTDAIVGACRRAFGHRRSPFVFQTSFIGGGRNLTLPWGPVVTIDLVYGLGNAGRLLDSKGSLLVEVVRLLVKS
jgi:hypothetical protein